MKNNILSFVDAFYDLAFETKNLSKFIELSKETKLALLELNFIPFLADFNITKDEKLKFLKSLYNENNLFINWMMVLIENKLIRRFDYCLDKFISIYNINNNILEGEIWSTFKMSSSEINRLTDTISKKMKKKVYLISKIDPLLIGGIKLIIGDNVWDNSILKKINDLTSELINKKGLITLDGEY